MAGAGVWSTNAVRRLQAYLGEDVVKEHQEAVVAVDGEDRRPWRTSKAHVALAGYVVTTARMPTLASTVLEQGQRGDADTNRQLARRHGF